MRTLLALAGGSAHRGRLVLAALLAALTSLCAVALMGTSAWLISRAAEHPEASTLTIAAVAVRTLGLGRGLARYAERLVGHDAALRSVADLRVDVFRSLAGRRSLGTRPGEELSRVVSDVDAVQDLWLRCVLPLTAAVLVSVVSVAACWAWDPATGAVLLLGLGTALVVLPLLGGYLARREGDLAAQRADYLEAALDVVHGSADLIVLGAMDQAQEQARERAAALALQDRRGALRGGAISAVGSLIQGLTVVAVAVAAVPAVQAGRLPRVGLAVVVLVALASFEPVLPLGEAGGLLPRTWGAAQRLLRLSPAATPAAVELPTAPGLVASGLSLTYPGASVPAVADVDLALSPGRKVVVVGPSGSGKSTLLALLAGALEPDTGTALLGGRVVADLDGSARASHLVLAEQEAHLFDTTVRDNLRVARPDATPDELDACLRTAGLAEWVDGLPRGLDTGVGERGSRVSGGERRRLSVARALLSDAGITLLDEPTEGLDALAADALLRDVLAAAEGRTVVVVTHRLVALDAFDEVVVMDRGRVVQRGTAADLLEQPGLYAELALAG